MRTTATSLLAAGLLSCTNPANPQSDLSGQPDLSAGPDEGVSVLRLHRTPSREGVYIDRAFTKAAVKSLHIDTKFVAKVDGPVYAQALFLDGSQGGAGKDLLFSATEQDKVYAFDAKSGMVVWQRTLGTPVPHSQLPCGNIDPLGITGTPVIDLASRTLFVDAMTTPDGGNTKKHLVFALSVDNGSIRPSWPVDVNAKVSGFDSTYQNQRSALISLGGRVYVAYGGHAGDCGPYLGWVVGISMTNPADVKAWHTRAKREGGSWAPGGPASDGQSIFVTTGNTDTQAGDPWADGEAIIRLTPNLSFSTQPVDFFTPTDWQALDVADADIGGSGPILFDLPGAKPDHLALALGKNGKAYLMDRTNLGGITNGVTSAQVASEHIINSAAVYSTAQGTYVAFKGAGFDCPQGQSGDLTVIRIGAAAPPTIKTAWCAMQVGNGSPMVTTTDGRSEAIVWSIGAEGDQGLHGFDADTGSVVYNPRTMGGVLTPVARFQTPMAAKGRIYVQANDQLYAFTTQ